MGLIIPAGSDCKSSPQRPWQTECEHYLLSLLQGYPFRNPTCRPRLGYFAFANKELGEAQIVQVWDENWILHVQCAWHGDEERAMKYGLSPHHIHIALDVERSALATFRSSAIQPVQEAVLLEVQPIAREELGGIVDVRGVRDRGHHMVWQPMPFDPDSADSILQVAERMATYVRFMYADAWDAVLEWADRAGATIERSGS